jgi:hypothetical protein
MLEAAGKRATFEGLLGEGEPQLCALLPASFPGRAENLQPLKVGDERLGIVSRACQRTANRH